MNRNAGLSEDSFSVECGVAFGEVQITNAGVSDETRTVRTGEGGAVEL